MSVKREFVREAVLRMHEQGVLPNDISCHSGVPLTTVRRWIGQSDPEYREENLARAAVQKERKERDMRAVVALADKVLAPAEIADQLKMNRRRVHKLLAEYRRTCQGEKEWGTFGDRLRAQIAAYREDGFSMRKIAKYTRRSLGTVHYHLAKLGLDGHRNPAKRRTAKSDDAASGKTSPRKTGRPAELWTCALLADVAERPGSPITSVHHSPDDRCDIQLVIGSYVLMVQVRTASWSGNSLLASITRYGGRPYRPENCDLLFGYDERSHALYCRIGTDVWKRSSSIAFRRQDSVSSEHPERILGLIDAALGAKLRWLESEHRDEKPQFRTSSDIPATEPEAGASPVPIC